MQTPLHDDLIIAPRSADELYKTALDRKKKIRDDPVSTSGEQTP